MWDLHGSSQPSQWFSGHAMAVTGVAVSPGRECRALPRAAARSETPSSKCSSWTIFLPLFPKTRHSCALALGTTPSFCGTWGPDSVWSELQSPGTWYELRLAAGPGSRREDGARGRAWARDRESHDQVWGAWVPLPLTSNSLWDPSPSGCQIRSLKVSAPENNSTSLYWNLSGVLTYSFKTQLLVFPVGQTLSLEQVSD